MAELPTISRKTTTERHPIQNARATRSRTRSLSGRNNQQQQSVLSPPPLSSSTSLTRSSPRRRHSSTTTLRSPAPRTSPTAENSPSSSLSPSTPNRQRLQSPSYWPLRSATTTSGISPAYWGQDTFISDGLSLDSTATLFGHSGGDDDDDHDDDHDDLFLSTFADADFSSPSTYPPFTTHSPPSEPSSQPVQFIFQPQRPPPPTPAPASSAASLRQTPACIRALAAPPRTTTERSSSSPAESQNTTFTTDGDGWDLLLSQGSGRSFSAKMPPPTPVQHVLNETTSQQANKRMRTSQPSATVDAKPSLPDDDDDDDLFGENITTQGSELIAAEDLTTIDLTEANQVPEELKKPEPDNRVKVSNFQCVICMDDVKTLTLTHCGKSHLFRTQTIYPLLSPPLQQRH
ncbi:hypothetical protein NOR_06564 [Metarhizium rileyi]|uniref:Zinc finger, RING/FYVE/PHD-type n=1 Tax=Metarhizium rileyi (strain RCEF 4871) TaxID=1649241 RepID=A0A167A4C0_METRR|nr:hypothetical protein NOR_06564 [Metarhizium rileyi RCEF 4871]